VWLWRGAQNPLTDVRWGRATPSDVRAGVAAAAPARGSVARALGRVEARELLSSGWFAGGMAFCVLFVVAGGVTFVHDVERSWWGYFWLLALLVHPLCGLTVVATHRGVTRSRRDGTEELYQACPGEWHDRTKGHLMSAIVPVAAALAFTAVLTVLVATRNRTMFGPLDGRVAADVAVVALLAGGAGVLGVAVGRWWTWSVAPVLMVVAVGVIEAQLATAVGRGASIGWLGAANVHPTADLVFLEPPGPARVVWLTGLAVAVGGLALLRDAPQRTGRIGLVIGLAIAVIGATLAIRPRSDAAAERLAEYVTNPGRHEVCAAAGAVQICALEPYAALGRRYADALAPVAASLPPAAFAGPVTMRLSFDGERDVLPADVRARVPDPLPPAAPGTLRLALQHQARHFAAARFRLAAHAVGLPTEVTSPGRSTIVAGQARGVLVLWYATRGLPTDAAQRATRPEVDDDDALSAGDRGDVWPSMCGEDRVLLWNQQDLAAARALFTRPSADVEAVLAARWEHWIDPDTPTDELLTAVGLPPIGTSDKVAQIGPKC
jgi:hypothetical protein